MKFVITISLLVFHFSCHSDDKSNAVPNDTIADTIPVSKKTIPVNQHGDTSFSYQRMKTRSGLLKLDNIESGYDSLQIRIWMDEALRTNKDLIVIKRTAEKWSADVYKMKVMLDNSSTSKNIKLIDLKSLSPNSGWQSFINKIIALDIMTLPDMDDIPGLVDNYKDGISYDIEIATQHEYRFYSYHLPEKFADKYPQAKKMNEIIQLLKKEFGSIELH